MVKIYKSLHYFGYFKIFTVINGSLNQKEDHSYFGKIYLHLHNYHNKVT